MATLLALTLIVFLFQELSPIDPAREVLGENAPAAAVADFRQRYGLDRPVLARYLDYVRNALGGSFGLSYRTGRPVGRDILRLLPSTIELGLAALVLSTGLGVLYALSTLRRSRALTGYRAVLLTAAVAPPFLLGIAGLLVFYRWLGWLPAAGRRSGLGSPGFVLLPAVGSGDWAALGDALRHLFLPALCVALGSAAVLGRLYASALRATLQRDFVQTARGRACPRRPCSGDMCCATRCRRSCRSPRCSWGASWPARWWSRSSSAGRVWGCTCASRSRWATCRRSPR